MQIKVNYEELNQSGQYLKLKASQYEEKTKNIEEPVEIEVSKWEKIEVIDCYYDQENGFKVKKEQNEDKKHKNFI